MKTSTRYKTTAILLLFALVVSLFPLPPGSFAQIDSGNAVDEKSGEMSIIPALSDGQVWTGKSVDSMNATDDIFNVKLEALGKAFEVDSSQAQPVNVVLVLDASTSMDDKPSGSTKTKLQLMIEAANDLIATILATGNPGNKVGIVTFNDAAKEVTDLRSTVFTMYSGSGSGTYKITTKAATNIQAGMNAGYKILNDAKQSSDTAIPFMVVLSDGATWYYNPNYKSIPQISSYPSSGWTSESGGYNGNGTSSNSGIKSGAITILQGQYLKDQMPEMELFTIGFGTSGNKLTTATLNPTGANITAVTGGGSSPKALYEFLGELSNPATTYADGNAAGAALNYVDAYYASNEDLQSLKDAFNQILTSINTINPLAAGSSVTIKDVIGDDFEIPTTMTMVLKSGTYTLTKSGSNFTGTGVPAGVSVSVSGNEITWVFPASELPYIEGANNPGPASLSFNVELKSGAAAGTMFYTNYDDGAGFMNRSSVPGATAEFELHSGNPLFAGDGNVILPMENTGKIKLKSLVKTIRIEKKVEAFDGSNKGQLTNFGFNVSISGFSGQGNIFNSDATAAGSFAITSGAGSFTLQDGQYAEIPAVPVGKSYVVNEQDYSNDGYVTTVSGSSSGVVSELADPIVFTNTFYPSAVININKSILTLYQNGVAIPDGVTFPFGLYTDQDPGSKISGVSASVTTASGGNSYSASMNVKIKKLKDLGLFNSGNSVTLFVKEEAPTGAVSADWILDDVYHPVTINKDGSVSYGVGANGVLMRNHFRPLSGLVVNKALAGGDPDKLFSFTVSIEAPADYNYNYSISVAGGAVQNESGSGQKVFNFSLKGGESASINGIPVGTPYTITEADYSSSGYYTGLSGNTISGIVGASGSSATITNTFKEKVLTIRKSVVGMSNPGDFNFQIMIGQNSENFTLGHGESKTFTVPVGASVLVKELNGAGFETTVSKDGGTAVNYNSSGFSLIMEDKNTDLLFTNTFKEGSLTVSKSVVGPGPSGEEYRIRVTFSGSNFLSEIKAVAGGENVAAVSVGVFEVDLKAGESVLFTDVPDGTSYNVVEIDSGSADSFDINFGDTGKVISDKDQDMVTVVNMFESPSPLTVSKVVPSTGYDKAFSGRFGFTIHFFWEGEDNESYELKGHELPVAPAGANFTKVSGEGYVYYTFTLGAGESIVFGDLPVGLSYVVVETDDGGARTKDAQSGEGIIGDSPNEPLNAVFTNNFNMDTGELSLTKLVTGDKVIAPDIFRFTVEFEGQTDITSEGYTGTVDGNKISFAVEIGDGEQVVFRGIKAGTSYTITEITGTDSGSFDPGNQGTFEAQGWSVVDRSVTSVNNYELPEITTSKDAFKGEVKISDDGGLYVGEEVTYVVEVENTGNKAVRLDKIEDSLFGLLSESDISVKGPDGSDVPFSLDKSGESKFLVLTGGVDLEPGEKVVVTYNHSYGSAGEKINNATAYATYFYSYNVGDDNSREVDDGDDAKITVFNPSDMKIEKKVAAVEGEFHESVEVAFGDVVIYKLEITNNGEADLFDLTVTDYQMYVANILSVKLNGSSVGYSIDGNSLTLADVFEAGDVLTILYQLKAVESHVNEAMVNAFDGLNELEDDDDAEVMVDLPTVEVSKEGDKSNVLRGESVEYTIRIENTFGRTLDLISVSDSFFKELGNSDFEIADIKLSLDGGAATAIDAAMIDEATGTIHFGVDEEGTTVYPKFDSHAEVTYTVTFNELGYFQNRADGVAGYRGALAEGKDDWEVRVKDPSGLSVNKLANGVKSATISKGSQVTYTVTVENTGRADLNLAFLQDPMFAASGLVITGLVLRDGSDVRDLGWHLDGDMLYISGEEDWLFFKPGMKVELTYKIAMSSDYTNKVTATAFEEDESKLEEDDTANVRIRKGGGGGSDKPDEPTVPEEPDDTGILDEEEIEEPEIPAGPADVLPKTGGVAMSTVLGLFGALFTAGGGAGYLRLKRRKEDQI